MLTMISVCQSPAMNCNEAAVQAHMTDDTRGPWNSDLQWLETDSTACTSWESGPCGDGWYQINPDHQSGKPWRARIDNSKARTQCHIRGQKFMYANSRAELVEKMRAWMCE